jgi:MFS transporter, OFA family, oxalate/formate antiporter
MLKDLLEKNRWWVVLGAILIQLALGSLYSWGSMTIFVSPVLDLAREVTVYIFGVSIIAFAITMVVSGNILKKIGPQKTAILGGVVLTIGVILSAVFISSKSFVGLILSYGFLFGAGIGISYVVPIATANKWFPDKKGFITGIAVAGFGAGSFIFNYLIKFLANPDGLEVTNPDFLSTMEKTTPTMYIVLAIVYMVMVLGGSLFMINPPEGYVPEGWVPPSVETGNIKAGIEFERSEILKFPQTYLMIGAFLFSAMCGLIVIGSFASFAKSVDDANVYNYVIGTVDFVLIGSLAALFNGAGRVVWGKIADLLDFRRTMIIMFILQAILCFAYFYTNTSPVGFTLVTCFIFFCFGGNLSLFPTGTSDLFGKNNMGSNYGVIFIGYGVAGFVGAVAVSAIVASFGGYLTLFIFMGSISICAAIFAFLVKPVKKPN